jgi:quaternary ammonium compound-resistance protein SugE
MPWLSLLVSAVLEAVWATALGRSEGFSRPLPTVIFLIGILLGMVTLGYAAKHIPISTAYAVWTGTGAALTVAFAMATGHEAITTSKVVMLAGIVAAVIGLKLVKAPAGPHPAATEGTRRAAT